MPRTVVLKGIILYKLPVEASIKIGETREKGSIQIKSKTRMFVGLRRRMTWLSLVLCLPLITSFLLLEPGRLPVDPMVLIQPRRVLGWCTDHSFAAR